MHQPFHLRQQFRSLLAVQLLLQPLQGQADDVAVMEFGAHAALFGKAQPEVVQPVDIIRPQTGRMRPRFTKIEGRFGSITSSENAWRGGGNCSQARPILRASSSEAMRADTPVTRRDALQPAAVCTIASNGSTAGTTSSSTVLPCFSAIDTTCEKSSCS